MIATLSQVAEQHRLARLTRHGELVLMRTPPTIGIGAAQVTLPPGSFQAAVAGEQALAALVLEHCKRAKHIADLFCGVGPFALRLAEKSRISAFDSDAGAVTALQKAATSTSGLKPVKAETRDLFRRPLMPQELRDYDAVVFDPPRQGAQAQAVGFPAESYGSVLYSLRLVLLPQHTERARPVLGRVPHHAAGAGHPCRHLDPQDDLHAVQINLLVFSPVLSSTSFVLVLLLDGGPGGAGVSSVPWPSTTSAASEKFSVCTRTVPGTTLASHFSSTLVTVTDEGTCPRTIQSQVMSQAQWYYSGLRFHHFWPETTKRFFFVFVTLLVGRLV